MLLHGGAGAHKTGEQFVESFQLLMDGIRELDSATAEGLRARMFPALLSLLAAAPGTRLCIDYKADSAGNVEGGLRFYSSTRDEAVELGTAAALLMRPFLQTHPCGVTVDASSGRRVLWSLTGKQESLSVGFAASPTPRPRSVLVDGFPYARVGDIVDALIQLPGTWISFEIEAVAAGNEAMPAFLVCIGVGKSDAEQRPDVEQSKLVPLTLRSVLNRVLPGCALSSGRTELYLSFADTAGLPALPLGVNGVIPGFQSAPAAPVPVRYLAGMTQPSDGLEVGKVCLLSGREQRAVLSESEQVRHIHVTGRTGTGKSTLLANMAYSIAAKGGGLLVLDPHGPLVDRIAEELPIEALERAYLVRAGDLDFPVPLNPLAVEDPVLRDLSIAEILSSFQTIFDPTRQGIVGPRFEQMLGMCLRTLIAYRGLKASILDVPRLLIDPDYQRRARAAIKDPVLLGFWKNHDRSSQSNEHGELISWVTSKWERFTTTAALRAILGSGNDALKLEEALEKNRIILLDLSKGKIGSSAASLLGFLHTTRIWNAALNRSSTEPFTVMVDEAHSFMSGALPAMLAEGRKYGISVVLAHQYLGQLPADLGQALVGNTATQIAFRAGHADAEALRHQMGLFQPTQSYTTLPDFSALMQRTAGPSTAHPHTLRIEHRGRVAASERDLRISQLQANTLRELVVVSEVTSRSVTEDDTVDSGDAVNKGVSPLAAWLAKREEMDNKKPLEE